MWVQSLGWEAPLEEGMAIHSSILAWRIPWTEGLGGPQSIASHRVGHNWSNLAHKHAAFFMAQLSHPYMTTGKTITLTIQTFVGKMTSLLFDMLPRFVVPFLPRSKCFLISWLQTSFAVILEPNKIKSVTVSTFLPSICHEVMGPDVMILVFWMYIFNICEIWLNVY